MTRLLSLLRSAFSVRLLTESVVIIRRPILPSPSCKRVVITRQPDLFSCRLLSYLDSERRHFNLWVLVLERDQGFSSHFFPRDIE